MRFDGQTVLVTGGTRGIGAGIAKAFLSEGAFVISTFRNNESQARQFLSENIGTDRLWVEPCDVSDATSVQSLFAKIEERHLPLDIVVNNAGVRHDAVLAMMSEVDWDLVLDTNLKGTYLTTKFAIQSMTRKRYGRIVMVTSPSGRMGFSGQGNYAASKAGQIGLLRSVAKEVARRNITVNAVSPGFIETELLHDLPQDLREQYSKMVPIQRFGLVSEVASAVLFLSSREASYITGAVLDVTGGL